MQQLRRDPVLGRWIIVQIDNPLFPQDFHHPDNAGPAPEFRFCPFCPGNEEKIPGDIYCEQDESGWKVRVVANKFPALRAEGELEREGLGAYDRMNGVGVHEVIIETPDHSLSIADLDDSQFERIIRAYRARFIDLKQDRRLQYVLVFKNHGWSAGASLRHSHSQLIALPIVPKKVNEALRGAEKYYEFKERCVFCDIIRQEQEDRVRIVDENDEFICFAPFASTSPFETWIIPRSHHSHFYRLEDRSLRLLAEMLRRTLFRLKKVLTDPPFNFIINTSPVQIEEELDYFHWHIEIVPKLTRAAGFEWGTGFYINPSPPETAAALLRECGSP